MARTLLIMVLALAVMAPLSSATEVCDCLARFQEMGGCDQAIVNDEAEISRIFEEACLNHADCEGLYLPVATEFQEACVPCPEPNVRDCHDRTICWPSKVKLDHIQDCAAHDPLSYRADLTCHEDLVQAECPEPKGCDGVHGSGLEEDECGVCGGNGQSCECDGDACDVLLTIDEESLTQTSATVNHCSADHWRGYQFKVVGVELATWESAISGIHTQCSADSGICVGFGWTQSHSYSAYHIGQNLHRETDGAATVGCHDALVRLTFEPVADSTEIKLEDVLIGADYDYLVGSTESPPAAFPVPEIKLYWDALALDSATLRISSDTDLGFLKFTVTFGDGFDLSAYDGVQAGGPRPALVVCGDTDKQARTMECTYDENNGGFVYHGIDFLFMTMVLPQVTDFGTATLEVTADVDTVTDAFPRGNGVLGSMVTPKTVFVPDVVKVPAVNVFARIEDNGSTLSIRLRSSANVRGCQFSMRGIDVENVRSDQGVVYSRKHADEEKFMVFDMGQGEDSPASYIGGGDTQTSFTIVTADVPPQKHEDGIVMLRDVRCASDDGYLGVVTPLLEYVGRCDTKWDGLCDADDEDSDGCPNIDDFAPNDSSAGCGSCGDLSAEGGLDILDIVMAVKHVVESSTDASAYNAIADTDVDGDNEKTDVEQLRSWVIDPPEAFPSLPLCCGSDADPMPASCLGGIA